jgi:hypothetical protein
MDCEEQDMKTVVALHTSTFLKWEREFHEAGKDPPIDFPCLFTGQNVVHPNDPNRKWFTCPKCMAAVNGSAHAIGVHCRQNRTCLNRSDSAWTRDVICGGCGMFTSVEEWITYHLHNTCTLDMSEVPGFKPDIESVKALCKQVIDEDIIHPQRDERRKEAARSFEAEAVRREERSYKGPPKGKVGRFVGFGYKGKMPVKGCGKDPSKDPYFKGFGKDPSKEPSYKGKGKDSQKGPQPYFGKGKELTPAQREDRRIQDRNMLDQFLRSQGSPLMRPSSEDWTPTLPSSTVPPPKEVSSASGSGSQMPPDPKGTPASLPAKAAAPPPPVLKAALQPVSPSIPAGPPAQPSKAAIPPTPPPAYQPIPQQGTTHATTRSKSRSPTPTESWLTPGPASASMPPPKVTPEQAQRIKQRQVAMRRASMLQALQTARGHQQVDLGYVIVLGASLAVEESSKTNTAVELLNAMLEGVAKRHEETRQYRVTFVRDPHLDIWDKTLLSDVSYANDRILTWLKFCPVVVMFDKEQTIDRLDTDVPVAFVYWRNPSSRPHDTNAVEINFDGLEYFTCRVYAWVQSGEGRGEFDWKLAVAEALEDVERTNEEL